MIVKSLWRWTVLWWIALSVLGPVATHAANPQRAQLAQEAEQRATTAAELGDWSTAARDALMAATLAPSRSHDWMAAATLVAQGAWSEAVVWIEAAQAKPSSKAEDTASAPWQARIRQRKEEVARLFSTCPRNLTPRQVEALAVTVLERPPTPTELQWTCVRMHLPAIASPSRVVQDGQAIAAVDGVWLVHTGVVDLVVGEQLPVRLRIDGENNADVHAALSPDLPALRGQVTLRGLAKNAEVLVDGAVQQLGPDGKLGVEAQRPHKLLVRAPGRVEWRGRVALGLAEQQTVDVRLRKQGPTTPWLVAGGGVLLAGVGGAAWTLGGDAPMTATRDPDAGKINNIGLAERQSQVDNANLMRGVGAGAAALGVTALAVGLVWRLITNLEPDEWRDGKLVGLPGVSEHFAKSVQP
ncbi:MAG: hypothetical protein FJ100_18960 [Deltaproteobacteria bacterium]|nr:hypothetical protein [Deltaproteobacteria bacterium]